MSERDDLDDLLDDLAETLDAIQRDLPGGDLAPPGRRRRDVERDRDDRDERGRRGRGRRRRDPRVPGPREFLRFTEEYTIPTLIAMLEATIRSLELLRAVLRVAGGRGLPSPPGTRGRDVVSDTGRRAIDSLDGVLADLQDAVEGQPTDPRARDLLGEARDLRDEIDDILAGRDREDRDEGRRTRRQDSDRDSDHDDRGGVTIDVADEDDSRDPRDRDDHADDSGEDQDEGVDVDAELDTIKREMGKDDEDDADDAPGE